MRKAGMILLLALAALFVAGQQSIPVYLSGQTVTATDLTLIAADTVAAEAAGPAITVVSKEKLLRTGSSVAFSNGSLALQQFTYNDASSYPFAVADRIIFKWWAAKASGGGTHIVTISTQSTSFQSYIQTTLGPR